MFKKSEIDYKRLREEMVESQIRVRGIRDERVLNVMKEVPRHRFVPEAEVSFAYEDRPLPVGERQTISQPYMVALMTEKLELQGDEKVLEIGTGSGYQTAVLSRLCCDVYTVERIASLVLRSKRLFEELGYRNIQVKVGDGTEGWEENALYDGIIVTAGAPKIPRPLIEQLAEGGRIVIPVGNSFSQDLIVGKKVRGKLCKRVVCGCVFVPLIGKYGWDR
ncbi:MAG TPA: protein-L-isoaspartate(D-aspartate) O-methyltransferase [Candidatus Omnitrophica bacterium]|nr:protein-L-isoaspartate(D-aspartate) O-methyltransferase [Candidatus Omnitrophota bacterium]